MSALWIPARSSPGMVEVIFCGRCGSDAGIILVERARQKASIAGGGYQRRVEMVDFEQSEETPVVELISLDYAVLQKLQSRHPRKAKLVKLRFFCKAYKIGTLPRPLESRRRPPITTGPMPGAGCGWKCPANNDKSVEAVSRRDEHFVTP